MSLHDTGQDPPIVMPASQRMWSEEVGLAAAIDDSDLDTREPGYVWSNGRRFGTSSGSPG